MQELPVPPQLAGFVRKLRLAADSSLDEQTYRRLPDGEAELVVRFGGARTAASVIGTRTTVLEKPSSERARTLLVRFHAAGAYPFFARPMSELTDRVVPLDELWQSETHAALAAATTAHGVAQVATGALVRTLRDEHAYEPASALRIRRAVRVVLASPALPRVAALASQVGLSERQLRRGFADVVGMTPKRFLRVVRFRRALQVARRARSADWAAIAESEGYFDQAHLIAEFRELSGTTPGMLLG